MATPPVKQELQSSTALNPRAGINERVLRALLLEDEKRAKIAEGVIRNKDDRETDARWEAIKKARKSLTVEELAQIMREMEQNGYQADASKGANKKRKSPFNEQAFYDALAKNIETAEKMKEQLEKLREEGKKEKKFLSVNFNLWASKNPVEEAMTSVAAFERYCHKNGITYDEVGQQLVAGPKPKTAWDHIKDFRFLIAAGMGAMVGLGGLSLAGAVPALGMVTGAFFGGLPYLALPFITLSIFRAFSEKSIFQEAGTLARFGLVMAAGFTLSLGITSGLAGLLPVIDPATVGATGQQIATSFSGAIPFSPSQYILHGIGAGAAFGTLYRFAKQRAASGFEKTVAGAHKLSGAFKKAADKVSNQYVKKVTTPLFGWLGRGGDTLVGAFNAAADLSVNKYTAPLINAAGKAGEKLSNGMVKAFGHYLNFLGIPAMAILMSGALAGGGVAALAAYCGYYATIFTGMAAAGASMAALGYFRYGLRKKEFGALATVAGTALGTSSSAATMPVTMAKLKEIGVPDKVVNSVVPLGANFNMLGTSLYLGATAAAALIMFGVAPTLPILAMVGITTVLTAFGAPGMPSSNIILLDPVMQKTGLTPAQSQKIYEIVLPGDRLLDMAQTALNVTGDTMVALDVWRKEKMKALKASGQEGKKWGARLKDKLNVFRKNPAQETPEPVVAAPKPEAAVPQPKKPAPPTP